MSDLRIDVSHLEEIDVRSIVPNLWVLAVGATFVQTGVVQSVIRSGGGTSVSVNSRRVLDDDSIDLDFSDAIVHPNGTRFYSVEPRVKIDRGTLLQRLLRRPAKTRYLSPTLNDVLGDGEVSKALRDTPVTLDLVQNRTIITNDDLSEMHLKIITAIEVVETAGRETVRRYRVQGDGYWIKAETVTIVPGIVRDPIAESEHATESEKDGD